MGEFNHIASMLPHRAPMLMISQVVSCTETSLQALSQIEENNPLLKDGRFPAYACLELLAQASGLFLGLKMQGEAKPGAIISVRDMQLKQTLLPIQPVLKIETNLMGGSGHAAMFQGYVSQNACMVMQATLTVSQFSEAGSQS